MREGLSFACLIEQVTKNSAPTKPPPAMQPRFPPGLVYFLGHHPPTIIKQLIASPRTASNPIKPTILVGMILWLSNPDGVPSASSLRVLRIGWIWSRFAKRTFAHGALAVCDGEAGSEGDGSGGGGGLMPELSRRWGKQRHKRRSGRGAGKTQAMPDGPSLWRWWSAPATILCWSQRCRSRAAGTSYITYAPSIPPNSRQQTGDGGGPA